MTTGSLTGLFEVTDEDGLHVCKVTLRETERQRKFDLRQVKKKEKHKGH